MEVSGQLHEPAALPPGEEQVIKCSPFCPDVSSSIAVVQNTQNKGHFTRTRKRCKL